MNERVQVAIVGGGPAGLSAAIAAAAAGARTLLFDENRVAGGQSRYRLIDPTDSMDAMIGPKLAAKLVDRAVASGVEIRTSSSVWGIFPGNVLGVECDGVVTVVEADRILLTTGSVDRSMPFPGGSLPGVFSARAAQILLNVHRVRPGRRFALIADEPEATELARDVEHAGGEVAVTFPTATDGITASGNLGVERVAVNGIEWDVDIVVVAAGRLADAGLALMAECASGYAREFGGFVPKVDAWMETTVPTIFAAGDCVGPCAVEIACAEGEFAGVCVAASLDLVTAERRDAARQRYTSLTGVRMDILGRVAGSYVQMDRVPMGATAE